MTFIECPPPLFFSLIHFVCVIVALFYWSVSPTFALSLRFPLPFAALKRRSIPPSTTPLLFFPPPLAVVPPWFLLCFLPRAWVAAYGFLPPVRFLFLPSCIIQSALSRGVSFFRPFCRTKTVFLAFREGILWFPSRLKDPLFLPSFIFLSHPPCVP